MRVSGLLVWTLACWHIAAGTSAAVEQLEAGESECSECIGDGTECNNLVQMHGIQFVEHAGTLGDTSKPQLLDEDDSAAAVLESAQLLESAGIEQDEISDAWISKIPQQLVLTARQSSLWQLPLPIQSNVNRTLALNPGLKLRFLDDEACAEIVNRHDQRLAEAFQGENRGAFRGDICRAVVLFLEGGVYVDLDVEPLVAFSELIGNASFMTAYSAHQGQGMLNAIMASVPASTVLKKTLSSMGDFYDMSKKHHLDLSPGPYTLFTGLAATCGSPVVQRTAGLFQCGNETVQLYMEEHLKCDRKKLTQECPKSRARTWFDGVKYGIFTAENRRLVAYSRFAACDRWGCGAADSEVL